MWLGKQPSLVLRLLEKALVKAQKWIGESWEFERLKDGGVTSASNETSVVLYGSFENNDRVLLTGDAGVNALTWAADYAEASGLPLRQFSFVQIPHHGSRRNVGPTIMNRLLGPVQPAGSPPRFSAFVSAPKDDDTHPRKMVLNAFMRRGGRVIATQGLKKVFWGGFPVRPGYVAAEAMPFASQVEEYD
jgi:beta-lactamase superfamily II metal-dependent hydrolase